MTTVVKTTFFSLGIGFITEVINVWLNSSFLHKFLEANLVTILIALLAINAATMGIVLTKVMDIVEKNNGFGISCFSKTKTQMLISIKEQIVIIVLAIALLILKNSPIVLNIENSELLLNSSITACFIYSLSILYDTAKGILVIINYSDEE
ncbi:hypothetical protein [Aeromonas enteropelogenes]|uniref:hypothetical protein n=1 Tax=Aeromonas TaxID=642 RepID=UPI001CBC9426|nr:hypothetical protein [Aeromonas enteropelogenes]UAK72472.1 hypothetical protein K8O95_02845 [Aeromonas enteropelogenes]UBH28208.1 hypothetical protein LA358_02660 [Aeromonas enteropelogenes]HDX8376963.1 hypothetical protein [Aeromonas dhakensis]HDZ8835405.1 hypothetical protein [Aeromonas dhakensis]